MYYLWLTKFFIISSASVLLTILSVVLKFKEGNGVENLGCLVSIKGMMVV